MKSARLFPNGYPFGLVLAAICFLSLAQVGYAKNKAASPTTTPTAPVSPKVVLSVDAANNSVVIVNHLDRDSTHAYKIDDLTKVTVNGIPGRVTDIKAGMVVTDLLERDSDDLDGITLSGYGGTPTPTPAATTKPKKK